MDFQTSGQTISMEWPYPIKYEKISRKKVDVLVVGGGIAGAAAGIAASKRGIKVAVIDKAPIKRSGCGGAGLDHYTNVIDNPIHSPITPEEYIELKNTKGKQPHLEYIKIKGSWDFLMQLEELGLPIRDEDDDFKGEPTRDEESKILKAYDYQNMATVKIRGGQYIKVVLYYGLRDLGGELYERHTVTSLLTENGKIGSRIVGAVALSMETGEVIVFQAKSVIICTGGINGLWQFSTEITGSSFRHDPNDSGDGFAMAWKAGAEGLSMFQNGQTRCAHPFAWPRFGVGNPYNTWFPCSIVDNNGKEIPWIDANGKILTTVEARNFPAEGQRYIASGFTAVSKKGGKGVSLPKLIEDLPEKIKSGEYELPLWADLPGMPEAERRSIWGMMIGNEGKTRYTLFDLYTRYGFNPDKDMLQAPVMEPDSYQSGGWFQGEVNAAKTWRSEYLNSIGELAADWNFMTNIPGLFVAGAVTTGAGAACGSAGTYAGNRAAEYVFDTEFGEIDEQQLQKEIDRIYAPMRRAGTRGAYVSWKELWAGTARVMQQECGENLTISAVEHGLKWLESIRKNELARTYARNPHELARVLEGENRIVISEAVMHTIIAKLKAEKDKNWQNCTHIFSFLTEDGFHARFQEDKYWLKEPYAATYLENYNNCLMKGAEHERK